jgi:AraC-like DNA-binding protein
MGPAKVCRGNIMSDKRRKWAAAEKLRILPAGMARGIEIADLCRRKGVSPTQYYGWKKRILSSACAIFEEKKAKPSQVEKQMAAVARLSPYHFARQFKAATGLPPHQYVISRRVERAKQLLQAVTDLSLAEVAAHAGFSNQSKFSRHFKRLIGVTARHFRTPARNA